MTWDFDVAIVGGGPAGTSTALHLVRRERISASGILLLEKARHPRVKPCAGAVSAWGIDALASIGVTVGVPHVAMRGLRVLAGAHTGEHIAPLGVVVQRCEFDASLWREARDSGVVALDGEPLAGMQRLAGGWRLTTSRGSYTVRLVAGCDGAGSAVRKLLGLKESARKGHLYVTETPLSARDEGPQAGLCDFDLSVADSGIEGYYWDFPTVLGGLPAASRGIYHANFTARRDVKEQLGRWLARRGVDVAGTTLRPFSTRPFVPGTLLALDRLVLVGEAAGIDATTGEGIAQAIVMSRAAAAHLARALRVGDGRLGAYREEVLRTRLGRHLLQSAWLARRVYGGRRGHAWRAFLAREPLALAAGARWYAGERVGWALKARLGAKLALALVS